MKPPSMSVAPGREAESGVTEFSVPTGIRPLIQLCFRLAWRTAAWSSSAETASDARGDGWSSSCPIGWILGLVGAILRWIEPLERPAVRFNPGNNHE
jgi:hypothetical protein